MEVHINNCDLLRLHNTISSHIENEIQNVNKKIDTLIDKIKFLLSIKHPYGVNKYDLENLQSTLLFFGEDPSCIKKIDSTVSYANWKESLAFVRDLKVEIDNIQLVYPMMLVNIRDLMNEYFISFQTPVQKSFLNSDSKNTEKQNTHDFNKKYYNIVKHTINQTELNAMIKSVLAKSVNVEKWTNSSHQNSTSISENNDVVISSGDEEDGSNVYEGINFQDLSRVNINSKYKYEKHIHFRDTIKQYQAQQQKTIPEKVIDDVKKMIEAQGLIVRSSETPYSRVSKDHIRQFLMETNNSKYYEDLQLIFSKITGKEPPNISMYEKQLYKDFDELVDAYLQLKLNRKNFLNSHYVLKQLLRRQKYKVPEGDLNSLKTPNRQREHDDIFQQCCEILGWNFNQL